MDARPKLSRVLPGLLTSPRRSYPKSYSPLNHVWDYPAVTAKTHSQHAFLTSLRFPICKLPVRAWVGRQRFAHFSNRSGLTFAAGIYQNNCISCRRGETSRASPTQAGAVINEGYSSSLYSFRPYTPETQPTPPSRAKNKG